MWRLTDWQRATAARGGLFALLRESRRKLRFNARLAQRSLLTLEFSVRWRAAPLVPRRAIWLFCDPRGGSTWFMERLLRLPHTAPFWEPFHPTRSPVPRRLGFSWLAPEGDESPELRAELLGLMRGQRLSSWVLSRAERSSLLACERPVIKCVRASRLLPRIASSFEFDHPPMHFVRHPVATAFSQLALYGGRARWLRPHVPKRPEPLPEGAPRPEDALDQRVLRWCQHNAPALRVPAGERRWRTARYEDLLVRPEPTLTALLRGLPADAVGRALEGVGARSQTDYAGRLRQTPSEQIEKWLPEVDAAQRRRVQLYLDAFGITEYRADDPYPITR